MKSMTLLAGALLMGVMAGPARAVCISERDIVSTDRPDDRTMVFTLRDHSVYRNDLPVRCPGLHVSIYGVTYEPTDPATERLCDGMVVFHLNDVGHASCIAGPFTRVK